MVTTLAPTLNGEALFGRLFRSNEGWVIDGKPFVMAKIRALFPGATILYQGGVFSHAMVQLPTTPGMAKDIAWVMDRYPLDADETVLGEIARYCDRYDRQILASSVGDRNHLFDLSPMALEMAEPPRPHQIGFRNLARGVGRLLLGDELGLGKTISAIATLCEPEARPALVVVPTHLMRQWESQIKRFLPGASIHLIKGRKPHPLPHADVIITAYTRLQGWQDTLVPFAPRTLILDEVQDLRHVDTVKRNVARAISQRAEYCYGLSATPVYNYGAEMWSVMDVIAPGVLGPRESFVKEWCGGSDMVKSPDALRSYLVSQGQFLRRTRKDLGIEVDPVTRDVVTLEGDLESLAEVRDIARTLALSVLSNRVGESDDSARQLDWMLRKATGVAKAKAAAEFVKMLVDSGERVFLVGWHRDVYEIWLKELKALNPVMYTGTESPAQKVGSVRRFTEGHSKVFICSLRSGAGLDGLQKVCSTVVFGELDWSPQVMEQVIGRLDREGQTKPVNAYFLTIDDGADPFMTEVLGAKQSQSDGLLGIAERGEILETDGQSDRLRRMAEAYLAGIGEAAPTVEPVEGLHAEVVAALRRMKVPTNTEREMQEALGELLPRALTDALVEREVRIGERGRLDFLVTRGDERIAVECKIDQTGRSSVYRQVRRYAEHAAVTGAVVFAPWGGVANFVIDETPVSVVDWSKQSLRGGR